MKYNKIWIFGAVGSGKTTLARKISKKIKIQFYSTDDFVYKVRWSKKCSKEEKEKMTRKASSKASWIIEGVHAGEWILPSIKKADIIVFLMISKPRLFKQVIKRNKDRKKTPEAENFLDLMKMLWWVMVHRKNYYLKYRNIARDHKKQFIILKNKKQVNDFLKELK